MLRSRYSWVFRYGLAVIASLLATALTHILWLYIQPALYPFFLAAVMLSSWFGGLGPGLVSTVLGASLSEHFFLPEGASIGIEWANLGRVSYFTGVSVLICTLNARLRHTQKRAEASAIESRRNQALLWQNQQTLRQSEERYRLLVEGVTDYAIFMLNSEGSILSWTVEAERILGYRESEVIGQSFARLFTQEAIQQGIPEQVLETAVVQRFSKANRWHVRKDGTLFWAHCVVAPLRDEAGNLQGFSKIMQDITLRKRAEEERNQLLQREQLARQEAESANRAKDEFLAILSHELRTPLTAITGWVGMLLSRRLDDKKTAVALETIERNAMLQMQLVEDLLDISRIIRGDLWLDCQPVNLVEVIQTAIEIVQPRLEEKRIQFRFEVDQTFYRSFHDRNLQPAFACLQVLGDAERLQQVVLNLLSNAIKFTSEAGEITIYVSVVDRQPLTSQPPSNLNNTSQHNLTQDLSYDVQIQVTDTGIGISQEFLPHVFDRFRQADSSNTRSYKGLGLGLAIVRYLVERQGGSIQADSLGRGQGATFTVRFPLLKPIEVDRRSIAPFIDVSPEARLRGLSILVVDDEADTRTWLATVFEMYQANVVTVASVDEALAQVDRSPPDVVISDIALPGKDGYALMKDLKQYQQFIGCSIPTIALTAHASPEDIEKTIKAGYWLHIAKPIKAADLIAAIIPLLESHALRGNEP